ncbi:glycoprotease [Laetiporus sulphureus 93-53]|uniref:N(6)-L-threonylcarbamoyladenine synthase n=1 Tax=Laetiporus sulphureus 93-53 TaxID=1314785 RepID=A0A165DDF8_9APHY|nr:glycoprotease [Laetiporus sulphureus 93-53]KZT04628.1 glycoprotease [Laetiporus sulphureus 93-53]
MYGISVLRSISAATASSILQQTRRTFTVLALESSADDTCAAVVTSNREILSNVVVRQDNLNELYGGIHPYVAIQAHQHNLPGAVRRALQEANMSVTDVDGIAYTRGPGIGGCLSVCSNASKTLAAALNKPLVGVHHMQAHALTPFLTTPTDKLPQYPFLTLLVSGGHTLLLLATSPRTFRTLATALDESVGRAFDKIARMLALPRSQLGLGAALEQFVLAGPPTGGEVVDPDIPRIPLPMHGRLSFSYTGLHSTVERFLFSRNGVINESTRYALAESFQKAAVGQLEEKLLLGLQLCQRRGINIRDVVVSGGVASNLYLRKRLRACLDNANPDAPIALLFPPPALCTDNAVMIAWASMHRFLAGDTDAYSDELRSKWNIEELDPSGPIISAEDSSSMSFNTTIDGATPAIMAT